MFNFVRFVFLLNKVISIYTHLLSAVVGYSSSIVPVLSSAYLAPWFDAHPVHDMDKTSPEHRLVDWGGIYIDVVPDGIGGLTFDAVTTLYSYVYK